MGAARVRSCLRAFSSVIIHRSPGHRSHRHILFFFFFVLDSVEIRFRLFVLVVSNDCTPPPPRFALSLMEWGSSS